MRAPWYLPLDRDRSSARESKDVADGGAAEAFEPVVFDGSSISLAVQLAMAGWGELAFLIKPWVSVLPLNDGWLVGGSGWQPLKCCYGSQAF
ncbi:hypothetical protein GCM10023346_13800 [Arthrobacter gyeryongensis]|uniref:Uncharacterized protein n=1 Tax=Arthrobacter gyeryongensis TaxID=1650592 RepID=A0ABP9SA18_9MICC